MRRARAGLVLLAVLLGTACRGTPRGAETPVDLARLIDSLIPSVEAAAGLTFRATPSSAVRTREEVRRFLLDKLASEFPEERLAGAADAYRLFGLLPDTLDLRALILDLYTEQVAGYYDPDSLTLYGVAGADPEQLRLIMAHELVHALQHQVLPLDSLMHLSGDADRQAAAQAMLEGHATLVSLRVLVPGSDVAANPEFWEAYREQVRAQQGSMAVFASAPLVLREGLIFPYLNGAEFMRWWTSTNPGKPLPQGNEIPTSTEQILFPSRYAGGDAPMVLRFADSSDAVRYEDTLGELEVEILRATVQGRADTPGTAPSGWGGDRYRVYDAGGKPALVWYSAWDSAPTAERFRLGTAVPLTQIPRAGYRATAEALSIDGALGLRVVIAPTNWPGWSNLPKAQMMRE